MPYIHPGDRSDLRPAVAYAAGNPGELNFQITSLILDYVDENPPGYQAFNDVIGALEAAKLEFYRRMVVPYEKKKLKEHGDVY